MLDFIKGIVTQGGLPRFYHRKATVFGNEAEFRWKRYANSRRHCIKTTYNLSEDEHVEIVEYLMETVPNMRLIR